ncbi:uncharacterized protein LOC116432104 isoform X1 [Nomia melanderi]|uniref:uncharacterized protein LOC116432104 isoform X1 n=2 Tax=Nomia melanderi TaxID=2448451 RepID=UPI003FCD9C1C
MSLCLRKVSNKFIPFVNLRKQITKIDRHLLKHVKSSAFLEEFLNSSVATCVVMNYGDKYLNSKTSLMGQYSLINYFDICTTWPDELNEKCNWNQQRSIWMQRQRQTDTQSMNINNITSENKIVLSNDDQQLKLHVDHNGLYANNKSCLPHSEVLSINRYLINSPNSIKKSILHTDGSPNVQNMSKEQPSENRIPSEAQLQHIFDCLSRDLPQLFVKIMDYTIYTTDVVFINNIRGTEGVGINHYVMQIALLRIIARIKFVYVKLNILKITMHPEDSSIKVRWRIIGIPDSYIFLFWKYRSTKDNDDDKHVWYDGFSTFYVNNDGKVFKHVVDKMMPDQSKYEKTPIAAKLALFVPLLDLDTYASNLCSEIK